MVPLGGDGVSALNEETPESSLTLPPGGHGEKTAGCEPGSQPWSDINLLATRSQPSGLQNREKRAFDV